MFETPKASLTIIYLIALKKGVWNSLQYYSDVTNGIAFSIGS